MCSWHCELDNYQQSLHNSGHIDDVESKHHHLSSSITNIDRKVQVVWCRRVWS